MQYANLIFFAEAVGATSVVQKPFQNFQNIFFDRMQKQWINLLPEVYLRPCEPSPVEFFCENN